MTVLALISKIMTGPAAWKGVVVSWIFFLPEAEATGCQYLEFEFPQKFMEIQEGMSIANTRDSSQTKRKMDFGAANVP